MEKFTQDNGSVIVDKLILAIQENKQYLSDIDGKNGDGSVPSGRRACLLHISFLSF